MRLELRLPLTPETATFGSAPPEFWEHCDFARAFVDGVYKGEGTDHYLHVPCHRDDWPTDCEVCQTWGWPGTVHRLWPRFHTPHRSDRVTHPRIGPWRGEVRRVQILKDDSYETGWVMVVSIEVNDG